MNKKKIYEILEKMILALEQGNHSQIKLLNDKYDILTVTAYSNPPTMLDLQFDNCRQFCFMASLVPDSKHVEEIRNLFERLPKPKF